MKVRVSIPGTYMVMEMDEEQAHRAFRKILELLCISGMGSAGTKPDGMKGAAMLHTPPVPNTNDAAAPEVLLEPEVESEPGNEPEEPETEDPVIPAASIGYGGFLYIKCPDCGQIKGFCAKSRLSNFRCDCGSVTRLEHMVPLYMTCECGRNARYLTNMEDPTFDIICYDCGSPVAVAWNPKKKQYETIRG